MIEPNTVFVAFGLLLGLGLWTMNVVLVRNLIVSVVRQDGETA